MNAIFISDLEQLSQAATKILQAIQDKRIVCFYGAMGAGKTTLIKSICRRLGVTDPVVSPTFALVNEYKAAEGKPVFHFDFYRVNRIEEVYDLGYEEYFYGSDSLCLIEWPELVEDLLPTEGVVRLSIEVQPDGSRVIRPND